MYKGEFLTRLPDSILQLVRLLHKMHLRETPEIMHGPEVHWKFRQVKDINGPLICLPLIAELLDRRFQVARFPVFKPLRLDL